MWDGENAVYRRDGHPADADLCLLLVCRAIYLEVLERCAAAAPWICHLRDGGAGHAGGVPLWPRIYPATDQQCQLCHLCCAGYFAFQEPVARKKIVGILIVMAGVFLLAKGESS